MTGLHGLHVVIGMIAITWALLRAMRGDFSSKYFFPVENVGLYWHLVDLIWIYPVSYTHLTSATWASTSQSC